jgi:hypothetical protein
MKAKKSMDTAHQFAHMCLVYPMLMHRVWEKSSMLRQLVLAATSCGCEEGLHSVAVVTVYIYTSNRSIMDGIYSILVGPETRA